MYRKMLSDRTIGILLSNQWPLTVAISFFGGALLLLVYALLTAALWPLARRYCGIGASDDYLALEEFSFRTWCLTLYLVSSAWSALILFVECSDMDAFLLFRSAFAFLLNQTDFFQLGTDASLTRKCLFSTVT